MTLSSPEYLFFMLGIGIIHYLIPRKYRWLILLTASYYLYLKWDPTYIILLITLTIINHLAALQIHRIHNNYQRNFIFVLSISINMGALLFFKYFDVNLYSIYSRSDVIDIFIDNSGKLLFPLGLSFYSFRLISYMIDVYRGRQTPEVHPGKFALYISFFPTLVAGPIERANHFLPKINQLITDVQTRLPTGLLLITWGFFKKLVIADRLALIVNNVYNSPTEFSGIPLIIATNFYAIQIYCDFSGYTDIAIGTAKILGYDLTENFRQPYFSKSISEFWRRWHITLSNWFRDYVFFPLERKRHRNINPAQYLNILLIFLLTGMWHGSTVNFIIWGLLQGIFIILPMLTANVKEKLIPNQQPIRSSWITEGLRILFTFQLISFSWIFFRSNSISDAIIIVTSIFTDIQFSSGYGMDIGGFYEIAIISTSLLILLLVDIFKEKGGKVDFVFSLPIPIRWSIYYFLIFSILIFGKFNVSEFIYAGF
jgi:alginate O-acetyltransferase complex protein AlgI